MGRKKWLVVLLAVAIALVVLYFLGPEPAEPQLSYTLPAVPTRADSLENYIKQKESAYRLKPGNMAQIVWYNDSAKTVTEYAIVYLHGFSASHEEGRPVHTNIARKFGCNLFLCRLAEHGIDEPNPMINLTVENYWISAMEAFSIAQQLGKKVIVMGTSTGGTLALMLAAKFPAQVHSLVLLSPNIAIRNDKAFLLNNPWGLQIARTVTGNKNVIAKDTRPIYKQYWHATYPLEATVQLQELLENYMTTETFERVKQPTLMLYYYKNETLQDSVVSVPAMLSMFDELGTERDKKVKQPIPDAGDHVLGSYIKSKDLLSVQREIEHFMIHILQVKPVEKPVK